MMTDTDKPLSIEEVLADYADQAKVLRARNHPHEAEVIEEFIARLRQSSAGEYLEWVKEADAMLYSGKARDYLRRRFPAWERRQLAQTDARGVRWYRRVVLEHRGNLEAAREMGRREARGETG